jgi:hypothetical protein
MTTITAPTSVLDFAECVDVLERHPHYPTLYAACTYMLHGGGEKTGSVGLVEAGAGIPLSRACKPLVTSAVFDGQWVVPSPGGCPSTALFLAATQGPGLCLQALKEEEEEEKGEGGTGGCAAAAGGASCGRRRRRLVPLGSWGLPGAAASGGGGSALSCALVGSGGGSDDAAGLRALASLADGRLWLGRLGEGGVVREEACWGAHFLRGGVPAEVWCAAAVGGAGALWSGGDDGLLKGWDARAPGASGPTFTVGHHGAGVTCIAPRGQAAPHSIATGCYDQHLRLWDSRRMGGGPLGQLDLGGGVWRLKWRDGVCGGGGGGGGGGGEEAAAALLAAACMHGGACVVRVQGGGQECRVVGAYKGHEAAALTYGVEWAQGEGEGGGGALSLVSCAFYSKQVHSWSLEA